MSQENVELARRLLVATEADDTEAFIAQCDPRVEFHPAITRLERTVFRGATGYREFQDALDDAWELLETRLEQLTEIDDERVMAVYRLLSRSRGVGVPIDHTLVWVMTMRDGKLTRLDAYTSVDEALKAVWLEE